MKRWFAYISVLVLFAISISLANKPLPEKELWEKSNEYFNRHSYKPALKYVEQFLKYYPKSKNIIEAKVLKGKSQVKLRLYNKGIKTLLAVQKQSKALKKDPELHEFIGQAYYNWSYYTYNSQCEKYFKKAINLYLKKDNSNKAIYLYEKLIYVYKVKNYYNKYPKDWKKQYDERDKDVLSCYDQIYKIAKDKEKKAYALYQKALYIRTNYYYNPKKMDLALAAFREVIKTFPDHRYAPLSQLEMAKLYNNYAKYIDSLREYELFLKKYPDHFKVKVAKAAITNIKAPLISLSVSSTAKPGEKTKLHWQVRNVKNIRLRAYKIELLEVFKEIEELYKIDQYKVESKDEAAAWDFKTPAGDLHNYHSSDGKKNLYIEVPITKSGAYVIKAVGDNPEGKAYGVTTLILVSKLGLVVKSGKEKSIFYAVNSIKGHPVKGAEVIAQKYVRQEKDGKRWKKIYEYEDLNTDKDGLAQYSWETTNFGYWNKKLVVLAKFKDDYAYTGNSFYYSWYGYRRNFKIYGYTDRPVYRPHQKVNFKQIIRKYKNGEYKEASGKDVKVIVYDPKGNKIFDKDFETNDYGSISDSFQIADKAPLGVYRIQLTIDGEHYSNYDSSGNQFRVEEYKKPEFKVTVSTKKPTYKIGDKVTFKIQGRYYFGSPVSKGEVEYTIYKKQYNHLYRPYRKYGWFYDDNFYNVWASRGFGRYYYYPSWRRELVTKGKVKLNKDGLAYVTVKSDPFKGAEQFDIQYNVEAKVVDASRREIRGYGNVKVTHKAFYIYANPDRNLYNKGEAVKLKIVSKNPNNQPVAFKGTVKIHPVKYIKKKVKDTEQQVEELGKAIYSEEVFVDSRGEKTLKLKLEGEGYFKAVISTKDKRGALIEGVSYFWIASEKSEFDHYNYKDIEIILDKDNYVIGDVAKVLIHSKHENSYVLLTGEADDLYFEKVVYIEGKSKVVYLPITKRLSPNVWITASTFKNNQLYKDTIEVIVPPEHNYLDVKVIAPKDTFKPGETAEFTILTKNHLNQGVQTELSLGFVDSSIYYIQSPFRTDIRKFFYGQKRYLRVKTTTGFDYRHYGRGKKLTRGNKEGYFAKSEINGAGLALDRADRLEGEAAEEAPMSAPTAEKLKRAMPAKPQARKKNGKKDSKPEYKKPKVRKDFPDTMFWNAQLETNSDGVGKIKVTFPDTLTTWKIKSTAVTEKTEVGVYDLDIITRKNLLVRLQAPRFFQEKDKVFVSGIVHNYLNSDKKSKVILDVTDQLGIKEIIIDGKTVKSSDKPLTKMEIEVDVPKNGEKRIDFLVDVIKQREYLTKTKDMAEVTISALTDEESDGMQLKFPVLEWGVEKMVADNGILSIKDNKTSAAMTLNVPKQIKANSQSLEVILNPSIASIMIDTLPYLISYPYGCVEQTMSRFLPTVVAQNTLKNMGIYLEDIIEKKPNAFKHLKNNPIFSTLEMRKMVDQGLDRLYSFQHGDGGWGWWKNDHSNPYMSAYVLYGLYTASLTNIKLRQSVINNGYQFLVNRLSSDDKISKYSWYQDDDNVRCYMYYVLSLVDFKTLSKNDTLMKQLNEIWDKRDDLNEYSKILLALTQFQLGDKEKAEIMLENLEDFIKINKELETANFQDIQRFWYWYENGVESTAFALRAYLKIKPDSPHIQGMVNWLVRNRKNRRWFSTKDTAFAVYALADYMKETDELNPDLQVKVSYGEDYKKTFHITRENLILDKAEFTLPADVVGTGEKKLSIDIEGKGKLYYNAYLKYFTKEEKIKGAGNEIYVKRKYYKLTPKEVTRYRQEWSSKKRKYYKVKYKDIDYDKKPIEYGEELKSGDLIEVSLDIKSNNNFEYLMFEDPKPAGCEPINLKSGNTYQGGLVSNMELRDTHTSFFITYLNQGKHNINYRLRAEIPGAFYVRPSESGAMYSPHVRAISNSYKLNIIDK